MIALPVGLAFGLAHGTASRCVAPQMSSTLYDMPVSNHGARVRFVIYKLGLKEDVKVSARAPIISTCIEFHPPYDQKALSTLTCQLLWCFRRSCHRLKLVAFAQKNTSR